MEFYGGLRSGPLDCFGCDNLTLFAPFRHSGLVISTALRWSCMFYCKSEVGNFFTHCNFYRSW